MSGMEDSHKSAEGEEEASVSFGGEEKKSASDPSLQPAINVHSLRSLRDPTSPTRHNVDTPPQPVISRRSVAGVSSSLPTPEVPAVAASLMPLRKMSQR